jgi:hypothetical protein
MSHSWNTTTLDSEADVFNELTKLKGKRWLCRGQSKRYGAGGLVPSIDREKLKNLSRLEKLKLERQSIDIFRSTARFFADPGEQGALADDIIALMVLRHYGVPTRLLDWSLSPYVAAYFAAEDAAEDHDTENGEIWTFDKPRYERIGGKQWKKWPETTIDGSGDGQKFKAELTAFTVEEPPDWFICTFYPTGFPRQKAQDSVPTMTARFGRDHAEAIETLFDGEKSRYHLYVVQGKLKWSLLKMLRENHGIWRGSLFPDTAGAAETAHTVFPVR